GISGLRLDAAGAPLDAAPAQVAQAGGWSHRAAVAGGSVFLTWSNGNVYAEFVSFASLTHTPALLVSISADEQRMPAIAFSGCTSRRLARRPCVSITRSCRAKTPSQSLHQAPASTTPP